jgi:hypothetical protein
MQRYLETRTTNSASPTATADLTRHILSRQHLGKVVVVCDRPLSAISVVRKYWLKLSRQLQRERASTLNAEKILQLTYDITHMQHMVFAAKPFAEFQRADVSFVTPEQLGQLAPSCFSLYLAAAPSEQLLHDALMQLPDRALVVDYTHDPLVSSAPLLPKRQLEQLLPASWQRIEDFFTAQQLDINYLAQNIHLADNIDKAIDVILNTSSQFTRLADDFLELLHLSQPLHTSNTDQQLYNLLTTLHRRVYALTPGILSPQFAQSFSEDEQSLHDIATESWVFALAV